MYQSVLLSVFLICIVHIYGLPGPRVYVVTPASRPLQIDEGRAAPFYYHNWRRRMDTPSVSNTTSTTTTTTTKPKTKTPDLIFAEFEADNGSTMRKSLRKLLEKERVLGKTPTTSTTFSPIYVPDMENEKESSVVSYGTPVIMKEIMSKGKEPASNNQSDYYNLYKNLHVNSESESYLPSTTPSTTKLTTSKSPIESSTSSVNNVENIWHIIDSEKHDEYSNQWQEVSASGDQDHEPEMKPASQKEEVTIYENFALPGFATNPGNDGENESRAIRTEPSMRFPYVNLKSFQMKPMKSKYNSISNNKKGNNLYTSLDNFQEITMPVRGEAQDSPVMRQPVDRYNPAQPYLPPPIYGSGTKSKQSSPSVVPMKTVANLVPPPPPPLPKLTDNDFPAPTSYDSFPPYAPSSNVGPPAPPLVVQPPVSDNSDSDLPPDTDDSSVMDLGYRYRPPSSTVFVPTIAPPSKPFSGYSYNKPAMNSRPKPMNTEISMPELSMDMGSQPDYQGYHYDKPELPPMDHPPKDMHMDVGHQPDYHGYHYDKPQLPAPMDHPPTDMHSVPGQLDYPELLFNKPHGQEGKDHANSNDMGMMPPPAAPDMAGPPMDGFPHDFQSDFKFHHDFDDHDHYHHHHHHTTTTTTTTTEMPRVNRYSYYYLGKKLYYLPLYFSVYFIVYVGALIIKAVLRHKIVYPNSFRPNDQTASFFSKRSVDSWDFSKENLHEITGKVTHAIATAAEKYINKKES